MRERARAGIFSPGTSGSLPEARNRRNAVENDPPSGEKTKESSWKGGSATHTPRDCLPVYVQFDIDRYLSYGWKPSLVQNMIYRRHAYRITHSCIHALQAGTACPRKCAENCWVRRTARPVPNREWLEALRKKITREIPVERYIK